MKNKLLTALLSVAVAVGFWLYVVTVVSPQADTRIENIPVMLQNEAMLHERGLMVVSTGNPTVNLHLEGKRTDLNKINSSNISVMVDLSRIGETGTHKLLYTIVYPGDVAQNDIKIREQSPNTITVDVAERLSKDVPVNIIYSGTLNENYMADKENVVLDYDTVNITGPKSVVDRITKANISVDLTDRVESFTESFEYTLCNDKDEPVDARLVTTDAEAITMSLKVLRVKELQLLVNIVPGGGATLENSRIEVDLQSILISGSDSLLEGLDTLEVGTINLGDMLEDDVISLPIRLPEGVTNETGVHEVNVDIRFPDLTIKELTVTDIQAVNVPEGMDVQLITKLLELKIRGKDKLVNQVSAENITVTVDFSDAQLGTATVNADIVIDIEGVGAVGTYNVTATVRELQS